MQKRQLGTDGPMLSVIGLGCNNFGMRMSEQAAVDAVVNTALDAGINHFDTAEIYGGAGRSEEMLGAALGSRRDEAVIATKFAPRGKDEPYTPGALAARIRDGVEASLRRLRTDRIDLYYQHQPDPEAPIEEALEALDELVADGKVVHIANSNYSAEQIDRAEAIAQRRDEARFCGTQQQWSLFERAIEATIVPAAATNGLGVVPYFPLAGGALTGKVTRGGDAPAGSRMNDQYFKDRWATDDHLRRVEAYTAFAERAGHSVTELALAWLLAQPTVTSVIAGATKPEQVLANAKAGSWTLTAAEADEVAAIS
jgi:aryl-alcohol dehydrogenase-like predicted oxidoreductase